VVGWEWGCGGIASEVDAAMDASDRDLGQTPFNGDPGISENGQGLSQHGAEIARERLPWVGTEVSDGFDGSGVSCKNGDVCDSILVEVQLGLAGGRCEGA
jgi:hypothetical protein